MRRMRRILGSKDLIDERLLTTMLLIVTVDHKWEAHFACNNKRDSEVSGLIALEHMRYIPAL